MGGKINTNTRTYFRVYFIKMFLSSLINHYYYSSTSSPTIVLICTKTDEEAAALTADVRDKILGSSRNLIKRFANYDERIRNVFLVNDIYFTCSGVVPSDNDVRKSPEDLRNILAAINTYNAKREFLIPQNWTKFGIK